MRAGEARAAASRDLTPQLALGKAARGDGFAEKCETINPFSSTLTSSAGRGCPAMRTRTLSPAPINGSIRRPCRGVADFR